MAGRGQSAHGLGGVGVPPLIAEVVVGDAHVRAEEGGGVVRRRVGPVDEAVERRLGRAEHLHVGGEGSGRAPAGNCKLSPTAP